MYPVLQVVHRLSPIPLLVALALLAGCGEDEPETSGGTGGVLAGAGGSGGSGGSFAGCTEDCAAIETGACEMAVCNDGSHPGEIGACVIVPAANDTPCDDGLFCTVGDVCVDGQCVGPAPRDCGGDGDTCSEMACDEELKACVATPAADGTPCDDGLFCTVGDSCTNGVCGGAPMDCGESGDCSEVRCDEDAQRCLEEPINEGGACDDGLFCTVGETCHLGVCGGGEPNDCGLTASSECSVISCDEELGACSEVVGNEGQTCTNDDLCQIASTCRAGACVGVQKSCTVWDSDCTSGVCDPADGQCKPVPGPAGQACGDATGCSSGVCSADGNCQLSFTPDGAACVPSDQCGLGTCFQGSCWEDFSCKVALTENFTTCPTDWTLQGGWACGVPTSGPNAAYSSPNVIATNLSGNYSSNMAYGSAYAQMPTLDLSGYERPVLTFRGWVDTESCCDGFNVKVSDDGATFALATGVSPAYSGTVNSQSAWQGSHTSWRQYEVDLAPWAGKRAVQIRFDFRSDGSVERAGAYIDDVDVRDRAGIAIQIADTTPPTGRTGSPYHFVPTTVGGSSKLSWSVVGGTNHHWLLVDPATGALTGLPGNGEVGLVEIRLRVRDLNSQGNEAERTFQFRVKETFLVEGFEDCAAAGWTLLGDWECGVPSSGPVTALAGSQLLATGLAGQYAANRAYGSAYAESPEIDLAAVRPQAELSFGLWFATENCCDGMNLKISVNGGPFQQVSQVTPPYTGTVNSQSAWAGTNHMFWQTVNVNLAPYAGQRVKFRFDFRSDGSVFNSGFYVDDFSIIH